MSEPPFQNLRDPQPVLRRHGIYKGRIESRHDPLRVGRVRVRVEGLFKDGLGTEDLPWLWPATSAWAGGGVSMVPPVGECVWVMFEEGDWEYGVWFPGFWGEGATRQGRSAVKSRVWETSWYGGGAWESGPLRADASPGLAAADAPNNFAVGSPLAKRLELDDRKGREKVLLADRHDNFLWMNTEEGVVTLEAAGGNMANDFFGRGLTLSSNARTGSLATQLYSFGGWYLTMDDAGGVGELAAPSGNKVRLTEGAGGGRGEMWVGGLRLVLDEAGSAVQILTADGYGLSVNDTSATVHGAAGQCLRMVFEDGSLSVTTPGAMRIHAGQDLVMTADGKATLDAAMGVYFQTFPFQPPEAVEVAPVFTRPDTLPKLDRACDSRYYAQPE